MEGIIGLIILLMLVLGVWITKTNNRVRQLEQDFLDMQKHFEKQFKDVLLFLQRDADAHSMAYSKLTELISKQVIENMETVGKLEGRFNDLRRYVDSAIYTIKQGDKKGNE